MDTFTSASRRALKYLHEEIGLGLWMMTRVEGDSWIVLSSDDCCYGVNDGSVLKWSDSFCSRMVNGLGPNIAPDAGKVPAYRDAPISAQLKIGSYVGVPIRLDDGKLFGTLCAISPEAQPPEFEKRLGCVEIIADLLGCLLNAELEQIAAKRLVEQAFDIARTDSLTSLYNRRGWIEFIKNEEDRCRRYGHPACIISVDLDELKSINDVQGHKAGDELLIQTARLLAATIRSTDIVARLGGDEFSILCVECDYSEATGLVFRIKKALAEWNISASLGMAVRQHDTGLYVTSDVADREMYKEKQSKKQMAHSGARI